MKKNKEVDAYILAFGEPMRRRLREMRKIIRSAVPEATEVFSNEMPGYVLHDSLVWFSGIGTDVAFYPRGHHFKKVYVKELVGYRLVAGAILFPIDKPLPTKLITTIVNDRADENRRVALPTPEGIPVKIGAPARRALANARITSLTILASYSEAEILALHGIGPSALPLLRDSLRQAGLAFRQ